MTRERGEIRNRLNEVFRAIFSDDGIKIFDKMTANDIDGWDSLMHISLVVAIEKEFGLRLNAAEVGRLKDVGEMIDIIQMRATR